MGEKAFATRAALTRRIAVGRGLFRRVLCECYFEQNVAFKPLLNADKGQRSRSPEMIVCSISNFLYVQDKKVDKSLQNQVFVATGRNLVPPARRGAGLPGSCGAGAGGHGPRFPWSVPWVLKLLPVRPDLGFVNSIFSHNRFQM